jgi:hypothetical protein
MATAIAPILFFLDIRAFISRTPLALLIGSLLGGFTVGVFVPQREPSLAC